MKEKIEENKNLWIILDTLEERYIPIKRKERFNGTYIECESDGDTYFKQLSLGQYLDKMRKHFVDIIEELKSRRFSWKLFLLLELYFEYNGSDKKVEHVNVYLQNSRNNYTRNRC